MKLSLISEATIADVQQRIPIWIKKYFDNDQDKASGLIPDIIASDPTRGKYSEWLVRQWKNNTARFPEDNENLTKNLTLFNQKKSKLDNKDINSYTPGSLVRVLDQQFGLTKSERKNARSGGMQLPPGAELIIDGEYRTFAGIRSASMDSYQVVKITTHEASSLLCSGTQWCVANKETAEEYLRDGPLYLFYVGGERKYLVQIKSNQYMNVYDEPVDDIIKWELTKVLEPEIGPISGIPNLAVDYAKEVIKGRWPEVESAIMQDPEQAYNYAKEVIGGPWLEAEPAIMKDPEWAYHYAKEVIGGRWPEAEPAIMKSPFWAYNYAKEVIKGRWPEAELTIMKDPTWAYHYTTQIINMESEWYRTHADSPPFNNQVRWPEAEPTIMKDPKSAYAYAKEVIGGRWPEAEPAIMKDPKSAYHYARDVIKGRWPEAEPAIMKDPERAYYYILNVIKGPWPEAEPAIMKDPKVASRYLEYLGRGKQGNWGNWGNWRDNHPTKQQTQGWR